MFNIRHLSVFRAFSLLATVGALGGCMVSNPFASRAEPLAATGGVARNLVLAGTVTYRARMALPLDSMLQLTLREAGAAALVAEQSIPLDRRQVPVAFALPVSTARLSPSARYVFEAAVIHDKRRWYATEAIPVELTQPRMALGELLMAPVAGSRGADGYRAAGNEPPWRLDIAGTALTLLTGYGQNRVQAQVGAPRTEAGTRTWTASGPEGITVVARAQLCNDTMTGMPHPDSVSVTLAADAEGAGMPSALRGCGGDPASLLQGGEWNVTDVGGDGMVARSRASLRFDPDGRLTGVATCNAFTGDYALTGEGLSLSRTATSLRACMPTLMGQENDFLTILANVQRFEILPDGTLVLHAPDKRRITARRMAAAPASTAPPSATPSPGR